MTVSPLFTELPFDAETESEMDNLGGGSPYDVKLGQILNNLHKKIQDSDFKESVRLATTGNIVLSGLPVLDGVATISGNRILVKNQIIMSQNGLYTASAGLWIRTDDADEDSEVSSGLSVSVEEGATQVNTSWRITTPDPITVGVTAITFTEIFSTPLATVAPVDVDNSAAVIGVSAEAARADHKHDITNAAPSQGIGGGNAAGSATTVALSDHDHTIRTTTGPTDLTIGGIADGEIMRRSGSTIVGGVGRIYPRSATDPASPVPADGDLYFNTSIEELMQFDGSRSKFLSVSNHKVSGGRSGNTGAGAFYKGIDGLAFDAANRGIPVQDGTIISIEITRTDLDAATLEILVNGSVIATFAHSAAGRSAVLTENTDMASGVMSLRNLAAGNTTSNVQIIITYKKRIP